MRRLEWVDFWVHHGVHCQDIHQGDLCLITCTGIRFVESEALGVKPPVMFFTLEGVGGGEEEEDKAVVEEERRG